MSGLWTPEQPLWKILEKEAKKTLLFTGVNTDQCVLGTLVDAYNAGWNCVLVDDCCGTTTVGGREVSFHNIAVSLHVRRKRGLPLLEKIWVSANVGRTRMGL
jgi:nicotinamidase-related amidase